MVRVVYCEQAPEPEPNFCGGACDQRPSSYWVTINHNLQNTANCSACTNYFGGPTGTAVEAPFVTDDGFSCLYQTTLGNPCPEGGLTSPAVRLTISGTETPGSVVIRCNVGSVSGGLPNFVENSAHLLTLPAPQFCQNFTSLVLPQDTVNEPGNPVCAGWASTSVSISAIPTI